MCTNKYLFRKKANSEFQVIQFLILEICKPNLKHYVSKERLHKVSTNSNFFFLFSGTSKKKLPKTFIIKNQRKISTSLGLIFGNYQKHPSQAHNYLVILYLSFWHLTSNIGLPVFDYKFL